MALDDEYGNLRLLNIDEQHSEFLHVNIEKWKEECRRQERASSIGCLAVFAFIMLLLFFPDPFGGLWIFGLILFSLFYRILSAKRGNNLVMHGYYKYEITPTKIIRYTPSSYDIFKFKDLLTVKTTTFGLRILKNQTVLDQMRLSVYRHQRKSQLIIPNQLYAYDQVKTYILQQYNTLEKSS